MKDNGPKFQKGDRVRYIGDKSPMAVYNEAGEQIMQDHANDCVATGNRESRNGTLGYPVTWENERPDTFIPESQLAPR